MNLSLLKRYFSDEIGPSALEAEIEGEVGSYKLGLKKKGSSVPITVIEDTVLNITSQNVIKICQAYKDNKLQAPYIDYICSALQLAEEVEFESKEIAEAVGAMTDPEINGELTAGLIDEIIESLA